MIDLDHADYCWRKRDAKQAQEHAERVQAILGTIPAIPKPSTGWPFKRVERPSNVETLRPRKRGG